MNIALLIIDVQKAYIGHKKGENSYNRTFEYINETSKLFRQSNKPVIVIRHVEDEDGPDYKNVKELITEQTDIEIVKRFGNSFWKTDLENILKSRNVDFVVLCGYAAEYCVLATFNGSEERGIKVAMLQNGILAATETGLSDIAFNRPVIAYQVISYMLKDQ